MLDMLLRSLNFLEGLTWYLLDSFSCKCLCLCETRLKYFLRGQKPNLRENSEKTEENLLSFRPMNTVMYTNEDLEAYGKDYLTSEKNPQKYQKTFSPVEMQVLDSRFLLQVLTTSLTPKPENVFEFFVVLKRQQSLNE